MLLKERINLYLHYCKFQKELDDKTIKAYRTDLEQFLTFIGENENNLDKEQLNAYLLFIHNAYKQKTIKRKIASVKALFYYLEEENIIDVNLFHKVKTKFKEEIVLPKIIPRDIIEQLLDYLYRMESFKEYSERKRKFILRDGVLCIRGKGGKERYLQIENDAVLYILNTYKDCFANEIKMHDYFLLMDMASHCLNSQTDV